MRVNRASGNNHSFTKHWYQNAFPASYPLSLQGGVRLINQAKKTQSIIMLHQLFEFQEG